MYVAGAAWLCQFARPKPAWLARKGGPDRSPDEQREPRLRQPGLWPAGLARAGQSAAATEGSCCRDAATARASSVRRISRNVTGTAASAVSPVTQNAHWNPPVSAAAAAWPWLTRTREWVAATVDATATPIAPPMYWEVLSSPEAIPASRSVTPARAPIDTGMNAKTAPPTRNNGPA